MTSMYFILSYQLGSNLFQFTFIFLVTADSFIYLIPTSFEFIKLGFKWFQGSNKPLYLILIASLSKKVLFFDLLDVLISLLVDEGKLFTNKIIFLLEFFIIAAKLLLCSTFFYIVKESEHFVRRFHSISSFLL
jgi:hypothetical protein